MQTIIGLLVPIALVLAACGAPAQTGRAPTEPAGGQVTPSASATMAASVSANAAASAAGTQLPHQEAVQPAWFQTSLTDVKTGQAFMLADLTGKVVLVEDMAIWCSTCMQQQRQVVALHGALGERDDLVSLSLDVDPNEKAASLKEYADKNGFTWHYVVPPADVIRAIADQLGNQFLNPPSAPMFVIDRNGQIHPLPFGVKSADALQKALAGYLAEKG
jgi:cytochrome oxidase Cu insertion factor (SCO1/SenC/PrrC family)